MRVSERKMLQQRMQNKEVWLALCLKKTKEGDPFLVRPGSLEGHFLVQFGAIFLNIVIFNLFLVDFVWDSKRKCG